MTTSHDSHRICRLGLQSAVTEMQRDDPERYIRTEVIGDSALGNDHHYWVKVTDHRFSRHARFRDYEVEACCRWAARMAALDRHESVFHGC